MEWFGFRAAAPPARQRLRDWYGGPLGAMLWETECRQLEALLPTLFGYHALQLGSLGPDRDQGLLRACRISHRVVLDPEGGGNGCLRASAGALPIASDSVDVVVLPHTLEFVADPHQVLREVSRVLVAEGHVVILGFNPWGPWGWWRLVRARTRAMPWCGRFFSQTRIRDWLALLGLDPVVARGYFFRPPLEYAGLMRRMGFLERAGGCGWFSVAAGAYVVMARKRVIALTPVRPRWQARRRLVATSLAEPSARVAKHGG
ncbi:MAG: hypothetical protein B7Z66_00415 [Chromatiales bacterium 21-64-14]|nr:MAG: hypothetical protein B7Z66_00415 [Chromatiales bacterium 21-64-14]HQU16437.1 class I SAM-dependent methyltransferase [Gammaproteobacteria bacterium]